ncbi:MAG TPA: CinA family nicotinamide mononucleotide deamidase-related protein [Anaerolineaceae bacterium]|jgi:nicotinamide-nucleotide amidase|nr:CinA family nicotinamide mononucleotide deamidase-related protein [Anaerolineaceae bacterium]
MSTAEIITIGTELLLGAITDTNAQYLAKMLNHEGFDVYRITTIGDNCARITQVMAEAMQRSDLVITTGGLGPTVDDPTREAAAQACGAKLVFHEELWQQIEDRFRELGRAPTQNNERQAYLPENAVTIRNAVGTAPAFYIKGSHSLLCCLPGVPSEMDFLMKNEVIPLIKRSFKPEALLLTTIVHTIGIGESQIDQLIGHLEKLKNPTVGLAAHAGSVDIRITAKATSHYAAADLISPVLEEVNNLVGQYVFGYDDTTLVSAVCQELVRKGFGQVHFNQQNLGFLNELLTKMMEKVHAGYAENHFKNQYNKSEPRLLTVNVLSRDIKKGKELVVSVEDEKTTTTESYRFFNSPMDFEEWVVNRTMGLVFKHVDQKG